MFHVFPPWLCIRNLLPSFRFLPGFVPPSQLVGVVPFIFSAFFFSFGLPDLFVVFASPVLCHSSISSMGCFAVSFSWLGVFPFRVSLPSSFCVSTLGPLGVLFFLSWFWPFPWGSSLSPLCVLTVLLVSTLGLSFAYSFLVPLSSFLFLSLSLCLVFLVISCGFFLRFLLCLFSRFCHSVVLPLRLTWFHSLSPFAFVPSVVYGVLPVVSFLTVPALCISLSLTLAVSFHSRSLFACPCSPVRSFSRASYLFFPFGLFSFLIQGFLFASCCGSAFCLPVAKFNVPLFIVIGLVLFSFCYLVRFPSLSAGSESLRGSSHS